MQPIVLNGPDDFSLQEVEDPIPAADEVEIKVRMAGICGNNGYLLRGRNPFATYPIVPGHEYMGEVLNAPKNSTVKKDESNIPNPNRWNWWHVRTPKENP